MHMLLIGVALIAAGILAFRAGLNSDEPGAPVTVGVGLVVWGLLTAKRGLEGENGASRLRRLVLLAYAAAILGLCFVVPPWIGGTIQHPRTVAAGRAPVWAPPQGPWGRVVVINMPQLLVELIVVTIVAGVCYLLITPRVGTPRVGSAGAVKAIGGATSSAPEPSGAARLAHGRRMLRLSEWPLSWRRQVAGLLVLAYAMRDVSVLVVAVTGGDLSDLDHVGLVHATVLALGFPLVVWLHRWADL